MTREELINFGEMFLEVNGDSKNSNTYQFINEAIKLFKQGPCEDCISRKALYNALYEHFHDEDAPNNTTEVRLGAIRNFVKDFPSAMPKPKWIPVSESFPKERVYDDGDVEPSETVLIQLNNGEMKTSRYWGSRESRKDEPWIDLSYPTTLEVVAWMPLPNKYKYSAPHDCCLWDEENNCCKAGRSNCPDNNNCYMFD